jgi:hypothetical protein
MGMSGHATAREPFHCNPPNSTMRSSTRPFPLSFLRFLRICDGPHGSLLRFASHFTRNDDPLIRPRPKTLPFTEISHPFIHDDQHSSSCILALRAKKHKG